MERQERQTRPERRRTSYRPKKRPAWQSPMVLVSVAAVAIAVAVIAINVWPKSWSASQLAVPATAYSAGLTDGETLGKANAPVTMEIYSDFQCPYCAKLVKEQMVRFVADFVTPGTLRVVARDIDINGRGATYSVDLAVGARCAGEQDRYWQFHDYAFWNQQPENSPDINGNFIAALATAAGVDMTQWSACIKRDDMRQAILKTTSDARALGITSTPTLRLNGETLPAGVQDYTAVAARIRQLAAASPTPASSASVAPASSSLAPSASTAP